MLCFINKAAAQSCLQETLAAKYWQYRENLSKHFIVTDRDSNGCVGDGIGQNPTDPGNCSKMGYSLPATSINVAISGAEALKNRFTGNVGQEDSNFSNINCANVNGQDGANDDISWFGGPKHNWIEIGSETPHQMAWYWVTLATEYELLLQSGQTNAAQRTLEELFLGLQAYRRLDSQAQCLAKKRYDEITEGFEIENCTTGIFGQNTAPCLCGERYREGGHKHFDSPCPPGCEFLPQTDGFSGFFLRDDAMPFLENSLHDNSTDQWNIDAVGSDFVNSRIPPCDSNFSQTCYLVHQQNFMSQDQLSALLIGLAFIKKYIPPEATVVTCTGQTFQVRSLALQIAGATVDRFDDGYNNRISWPGSKECCEKEVFLSAKEGGVGAWLIRGFQKAGNYIDGNDRLPSLLERLAWRRYLNSVELLPNNSEGNFFLKLMSVGQDMGNSGFDTYLFLARSESLKKEIFPLINNLLHPDLPNLPINRTLIEEMLCSAPCGGPCSKTTNFGQGIDTTMFDIPEYNCTNTPNWVGQRWEGGNDHTTVRNENRQFNGLDFMALYNIYLLHYGRGGIPYFNPDAPEGNPGTGGGIVGPAVICPVYTANFQVVEPYTGINFIENLAWTTSPNLEVLSATPVPFASIQANDDADDTWVQADFRKRRQLTQYFNGVPHNTETVDDLCDLTYRKPLETEIVRMEIGLDVDPCGEICFAEAEGNFIPGTTLKWIITAYDGRVFGATGSSVEFCHFFNGNIPSSAQVTLQVQHPGCGLLSSTVSVYFDDCGARSAVIVALPNPAQDVLGVTLRQDGQDFALPSSGADILITRADGGPHSLSTILYTNGQQIDISALPDGVYRLQAAAGKFPVATATFIIAR